MTNRRIGIVIHCNRLLLAVPDTGTGAMIGAMENVLELTGEKWADLDAGLEVWVLVAERGSGWALR